MIKRCSARSVRIGQHVASSASIRCGNTTGNRLPILIISTCWIALIREMMLPRRSVEECQRVAAGNDYISDLRRAPYIVQHRFNFCMLRTHRRCATHVCVCSDAKHRADIRQYHQNTVGIAVHQTRHNRIPFFFEGSSIPISPMLISSIHGIACLRMGSQDIQINDDRYKADSKWIFCGHKLSWDCSLSDKGIKRDKSLQEVILFGNATSNVPV